MTKIYLAGSCSIEQRTVMKKIAERLRSHKDVEVYCPFELKIENAWDITQEEWSQKVFNEDTRAIREADAVILITPGRESTAGTNWEQGFAYALGKKIYVLQTTDKATSLMTYCGCNLFFNVESERHLFSLIDSILYIINDTSVNYLKGSCATTLT